MMDWFIQKHVASEKRKRNCVWEFGLVPFTENRKRNCITGEVVEAGYHKLYRFW